MATPVQEPEAVNQEVFAGPVPENVVRLIWNGMHGRDIVMDAPLNTYMALAGAPVIQGVGIKSHFRVLLKCWEDAERDGPPNLVVEGPTSGKIKVDPKRRIAVCCVEMRSQLEADMA